MTLCDLGSKNNTYIDEVSNQNVYLTIVNLDETWIRWPSINLEINAEFHIGMSGYAQRLEVKVQESDNNF